MASVNGASSVGVGEWGECIRCAGVGTQTNIWMERSVGAWVGDIKIIIIITLVVIVFLCFSSASLTISRSSFQLRMLCLLRVYKMAKSQNEKKEGWGGGSSRRLGVG